MFAAALETIEAPSATRRRRPRRRLRLNVASAIGGAPAEQVVVHDLSVSGLLLEVDSVLTEGEVLTVELPEAPGTVARVVWSSGHFYGCQFAEPVSPAAVAASLLLSPADPTPPIGSPLGLPALPPDHWPESAAPIDGEGAIDEEAQDQIARGNLPASTRIQIVVALSIALWVLLLTAAGIV